MRRGVRDAAVMLPRVHRIKRGGRIYCYHRVTRAALPDLPESHPGFVAAWAREDARSAAERPVTGALASAITDMRRGARWRGLSEGYRAMMMRELDAIRTAYHEADPRGLRARHINADLHQLAPVAANKRLRAWRLILGHLVQMGVLDADPSAGIRKRDEATTGREPWTSAEVAKFRARWPIGSSTRGCFELLWWTGLRVSDAGQASWAQIDADGVLHLRQTKTGGPAWIPWTARLPSWAETWADDRDTVIRAVQSVAPGGWTMLETNGRARSPQGLSVLITKAAREAGITGRTAHGLRKTRLTLIAEAGGQAHAIMSWGGHKTLAEAQRYTQTANLRGLVIGAEQERNDVKTGRKAVKRK